MIKNIIFDFGGVLLDIDYTKTGVRMGQLFGLPDIFVPPFTEYIEKYEVGTCSEEEFISYFQEQYTDQLSPQAIIDGFNAILGPIIPERLCLLEELKKRYMVFLLSNTNVTHLLFVNNYIVNDLGINDFNERYFHNVYYSHLIGMRKPNQEIYEHVLSDNKIHASETLFIDDNVENVNGAIAAGIKGVLHDPKIDIINVIYTYISNCS